MTGLARLTLPFQQIAAGLGVTSALLGGLLWVQGQRMHGWKILAQARGVALERVEQVQKEQNVRLFTWAQQMESWSKRIATNADATDKAGYADAHAATERCIAAHRVRAAPDRGGAIRAPAIAVPDGAGSGDGPGGDPELVAVTPKDVRICTVNTQRLKAVREWALDLSQPKATD